MLEKILSLNIFKIVALAIAVILIALAIGLFLINLIKIIKCRKKVVAIVVDIVREYRGGRVVYIPEIGYIVNDIEYYQKLSPSNKYGIKQRLNIMVDEKNPNNFMLNKSGLIYAFICFVIGVAFAVVSHYA